MKHTGIRCDIFCAVVDNYGDIGVCWRLAKILANEQGIAVRLWVDHIDSLAKLCPQADTTRENQILHGVEVHHWRVDFPEVQPAELVIETFACKLPEDYVVSMAGMIDKPVWINLEYLSAEDWVETHHKLPSPHPRLPLVKYFFFPGFTRKTGGLMLERDLLARRDAFDPDAYRKEAGLPRKQQGEIWVSLFSYENPKLTEWLSACAQGKVPIVCLVPAGRAVPQISGFFGVELAGAGDRFEKGNLSVFIQPFVEQERYDELLWACDINFVRGEDSCVRAQWAAKPFVWHIYPQHDGVHIGKLQALMARYCEGLPTDAARAIGRFWDVWNGEPGDLTAAWNDFLAHRSMLRQHSARWAQDLADNNLALNLLDFFREIGRMRAFEIEGQ